MGSVRSGDVDLHVEETGTGHPIVFVHEFGSDHREWEHQVRWFSRSLPVRHVQRAGLPAVGRPGGSRPVRVGVRRRRPPRRARRARPRARPRRRSEHGRLRRAAVRPAPSRAGVRHRGGRRRVGLRTRRARRLAARGRRDRRRLRRRRAWRRWPRRSATARTRIQLLRKSPRAWEEFMAHLREHSALGMANTMARYQALRPSLYDFEDAVPGARRARCCSPSATRTARAWRPT